MSYVTQPDPHPGRCKNFRHDTGPYGRARRCLEAEGTQHECRFEPVSQEELDRSWGRASSGASYQKVEPTPWVVPPR